MNTTETNTIVSMDDASKKYLNSLNREYLLGLDYIEKENRKEEIVDDFEAGWNANPANQTVEAQKEVIKGYQEAVEALKEVINGYKYVVSNMWDDKDMYEVWRELYGDVYPDKFEQWLKEYKQLKD